MTISNHITLADIRRMPVGQIAENIASAGEDPAEFIETTLKVSERKYTALPESWRKGFEPARTVRTGKPKFRLVLNEEVR